MEHVNHRIQPTRNLRLYVALSVLCWMGLGLHLKENFLCSKYTKPNNHLPNKIYISNIS